MRPACIRTTIGLSRLPAALVACLLSAAVPAEERGIDLIGINLSGASFAPQVLPGKVGTDYFYPERRHFAYYRKQNIRLIRFPFLWERLQHDLDEGFNAHEVRLLRKMLDLAAQHDQKLILDMHNYGRYKGELIGSAAVPYAAYAKAWRQLAELFRGHPALHGYDIMNEPHDTEGHWPVAAQAAVDAIRQVDSQTPIFVEGDRWASSRFWPDVNPAFPLHDPANRIIYEAHTYFDQDASGRYRRAETVDLMLGVERVRPFVEWLKKHGQKGFLGEYGVPDDSPSMLAAMDNMLAYLNEHCIPSAYWSAGPGWGTYKLAVEPRPGVDRPQLQIMRRYLHNDCTEYGPTAENTAERPDRNGSNGSP